MQLKQKQLNTIAAAHLQFITPAVHPICSSDKCSLTHLQFRICSWGTTLAAPNLQFKYQIYRDYITLLNFQNLCVCYYGNQLRLMFTSYKIHFSWMGYYSYRIVFICQAMANARHLRKAFESIDMFILSHFWYHP